MSLPELLRSVTEVEAPRAWLGVATALALYAGKKVLDVVLPRGARFRFMRRWLTYDDDDEGDTAT